MNKDQVTFQNMMISIFSLMLGALGLGQAMIDMTDQSEGLAAARRIFRAVDAAACDSYDSLSTKGERPLQPCKGNIEIKNMSFGYPSRASVEVCKLFNVSISAGEVVAIVGPSGSVSNSHSGRSLCKLIVLCEGEIYHYESFVAIL